MTMPGILSESRPSATIQAINTVWRFVRLGKMTVFQHYYGPVLIYVYLANTSQIGWQHLGPVILATISVALIVSATSSLDDLVGYRNGSDAVNYRPDSIRDINRKPLLTGAVTEPQVKVFAVFSTIGSAVAMVAAMLVGVFSFTGLIAYVICLLLGTQYSWGIALSYRTLGGEFALVVTTVGSVFMAGGAYREGPNSVWLSIGGILALSLLSSSLCSNMNDREGDAAVLRRTLAVLLPRASIYAVITSHTLRFLLYIQLLITFESSILFTLVLLPDLALSCWQVRLARRERWIEARKYGFIAFNVAFLAVLIILMCG